MKRLFVVLGTAVVVLPWLAGAKAQADAIHWTATGSPTRPNFNPSTGGAGIVAQNGDAGLSLGPGPTTSGTNSGSVVAMEVVPFINPDALRAATIGGSSANYSLNLALHDDVSGASGSLTFRGNLSGSIFTDHTASLANTFLGPTTETLTLGGNLYTVTVGPFVSPPPGQGGSTGPGSISASIAVQPAAVNSAPEPSSLVLACLGLPSLDLARRFRLRRETVNSDASKT